MAEASYASGSPIRPPRPPAGHGPRERHQLLYAIRAWVAIVRDVLLIAAMIFTAWLGLSVVKAVGDRVSPAQPRSAVTDCATPASDDWGTFCAEPGN